MRILPDPARPDSPDPSGELLAAREIAAGDRIYTGDRWEPVTADPTLTNDVVHVPTTRDGLPRTRTFRLDELVTVDRPDRSHPWWCSEPDCRAAEVAVLDENSGDLALSSRGTDAHYSRPIDLPRQRFDGAVVSAQLAADAFEPLDSTPVTVDLTLTRTDYVDSATYALSARQVLALVSMLGAFLPALLESGPVRRREDVEAAGCPAWCLGEHGQPYLAHARALGEVRIGEVVLAVHVEEYGHRAGPEVVLEQHDPEESRFTTLSAAEATTLGLALLGGAGLITHGGAR